MSKKVGFLAISAMILTLSGCGVTALTYEPACRSCAVKRVAYTPPSCSGAYTVGYYPYSYSNACLDYGLASYGYWGSPSYYSTYYNLGY